jgi:RHS repeat-associated protein
MSIAIACAAAAAEGCLRSLARGLAGLGLCAVLLAVAPPLHAAQPACQGKDCKPKDDGGEDPGVSTLSSADGEFPWNDYDSRLQASQNVAALGSELLGDEINLQNGALSFTATDISIPGNSALRVELARSYAVKNVTSLGGEEMLADWSLSVPSISGSFAPDWISSGTPGNRCSDGLAPPLPQHVYMMSDFWHGLTLTIPGTGGGELLVTRTEATKPADGASYRWVTSDQVHVSCLPSVGNATGEGFLAVTPDGTKYWFNWMAQYIEPSLKTIFPDLHTDRYAEHITPRRRNVLYATRVEDRFGNWVTYSYSNTWNTPGKLTAIAASDGRQITLSYGSNGYLASASDGARTWQYAYGTTSQGRTTLTQVTRPDGSRWNIGFASFTDASIRYRTSYQSSEIHRTCTSLEDPLNYYDPPPVGTITHPSGATGSFTVVITEHGRSNVPLSCGNFTSPNNDPNDDYNLFVISSHALSLVMKQLSGPGLSQSTWNYGYASDISIHMYPGTSWDFPVCTVGAQCYEPPCSSDACAGYSRTEVTGPSGEWSRYTFGNSFRYNEGKLLKVEKGSGPTAILETVVNTYDMDWSDKAYPARFGASLQANHDGFASEYHRPLTRTATTRDGVDFTRTITAFDDLAYPTAQARQSTIPGNPTRDEVIAYHRNAAKWVVGQRARLTVNGIVAAETGFDSLARPTWHRAFGKLQHTLGYHPDGTLASYTDGRNQLTALSDWHRGVPRSIAWPDGTGVSATVNPDGTLASTTDENGYRTCYAYDAMGRLAQITYPSESQAGVCDTSAWNPTTQAFVQVDVAEYGIPAGHWRQSVSTGNARTHTYFDALWRPLLTETYDQGDVNNTLSRTVKRYDTSGRLEFQSYPLRFLSDYTAATQGTWTLYDALGRPTSVSQDSEHGLLTTRTEYLSGFQTRVTNPRGHQTTTTLYQAYDEPTYDWPRGIHHPEGAFTEIYRDVFGKPTALRRRNADASQDVWRRYVYNYSGGGVLCKTIEPETGSTVLAYDAAGNLAWSAAGLDLPDLGKCNGGPLSYDSGRRVDRSYDARNRLTALRFPDGVGDQTWTYTPDGLPASIVTNNTAGGTQAINRYTYNRRRLPTGESLEQPGWYTWSIGYAYNANGHRAGVQYPTGLYVDFAPNALGQATRAGSYATGVSYHPNGAIAQFTYGNGVVHSMEQNARQLPLRTTSSGGVSSYEYGYDGAGNVGHIYDLVRGTGYSRWMHYDGLDRLTAAGSASFGGDHWHRFGYDALDNLKSWTLAGVKDYAAYGYDGANRLTNIRNSQGATVVGLGYDVQGNLANKNGQAFQFDYGNRLRVVPEREEYRYDGHGRRIFAWSPQGLVLSQYAQDGQLLYQHDERRGKGIEHVYLAGSLVALVDRNWAAGTTVVKYQHTDALGSPVAVTDQNRNVIERFEYEPFGAIINKPSHDGVGYTGHVHDGATGLVNMQDRYFDPMIGRFLSVDAVTAYDNGDWRHFNRYAYAFNNPYKFTDPDGRAANFVFKAVVDFALEATVQYATTGTVDVGQALTETAKGMLNPMRTVERARDVARIAGGGNRVADSSRAARREATRNSGGITSRASRDHKSPDGRTIGSGQQRQQVAEGVDGKPRVVTHHQADDKHANNHWHSAEPRMDGSSMRTGSHGELKYKSDGSVSDYVETK